MPASEPERNQTPLPLYADPAAGALIGTFVLALCLGGPIGLGLALIVWILFEAVKRGFTHRKPDPDAEPAARSRKG